VEVQKDARISAIDIAKHFGDKASGTLTPVLDGVSMNIQEGEFVVILGPSGCGKSTFLKILGGILPASSGKILIDGTDYGTQVPRELLKRFGFVFQNNNLLQWRTAAGNLKFMLETMRLKGEAWQGRVSEMLEVVGLQDYQDVYPHELSGGMRQRVGIARALVHDPDVLIMDQPMGALDAITRQMLTFELLDIWHKTQKTIIMVTNNVNEAIILGNRVFIFSQLPAKILQEIPIDIPFEERNHQVFSSPRFLELREKLNHHVRATLSLEEPA
jgi:NitT/TauT family transport system ATP-binding protein